MSALTDKIYSHLMAGAVGIVLGMGIASNRATNALNTKRKVASSSITEVTEQGTPPQYPEVYPWELNCSGLEGRMGELHSSISKHKIPAGCTFYTNPFWQYVCDTPGQYQQVKAHEEVITRYNLFHSWSDYRGCAQEKQVTGMEPVNFQ